MIQKVKGTRDILPPESRLWQAVETTAQRVFGGFGYEEIRLPLLEPTELFVRTVGEGTDIVSKEMYTFTDRKGRSLTLRPEGTAGVARAFIEEGLGQRPQPVRLAYYGAMFRYEKMQRGRYRQFSQIGIELLGAATPEADVEVVAALHAFLTELGFDDLVILLNNLGDPGDRDRFVRGLKAELESRRDALCPDCQRRWRENPLRILDCKVPGCAELTAGTTPIAEVVGEEARRHVESVSEGLARLGIAAEAAPRLVRGLDYYQRTVFEVVSPQLGEHTVICGGGRYDGLIADLGGPAVPGIGFAIGEDRLIEILPERFTKRVLNVPTAAVLPLGEAARVEAVAVSRELALAGITAVAEVTGRSLKAGFKWAGKIGAAAVVILGDDEIAGGTVQVKNLATGHQETVPRCDLVGRMVQVLAPTSDESDSEG